MGGQPNNQKSTQRRKKIARLLRLSSTHKKSTLIQVRNSANVDDDSRLVVILARI